jgi:hypothetical protein
MLYQIAFARGDEAALERQLDWAGGKSEEYQLVDLQAQAVAYAGRHRQSRKLSKSAAVLAEAYNLKEPVARISAEDALHSAVFGVCSVAKEDAARALALSRREFAVGLPVQPKAALALALCGDVSQAQSLANDIALKYPQSTLSRAVWLPMIRDAVHLRQGNPDQAIQALQPASQYEAVAQFWPNYLRGQAYLRLREGPRQRSSFKRSSTSGVGILFLLSTLWRVRVWQGLRHSWAMRPRVARGIKISFCSGKMLILTYRFWHRPNENTKN